MAVTAERVTVGATAVALNPLSTAGTTLVIKNGATAVDLGGAGVTSGAGFEVVSETVNVEVDAGDVLFAVCGTTSDVQVLRT